jgi:hypothetical protein
VAGAELDGFHGRGNAGVAGEHDDERIGVVQMQHLHAVQARGIAGQLQVHDRILRPVLGQQQLHFLAAGGMQHAVAPALERALEVRANAASSSTSSSKRSSSMQTTMS